MSLTAEQQAIIDEELSVLSRVLESLRAQARYAAGKFESEQDKSRDLNSSIVATHRAEDKAALASDEAVAHALSQKKRSDLKDIQKLLKRPYFGRIIVEEERPNGPKQIEYKLGLSANPDCRIIDWRSAPISKLYYEYREGDIYEEMILGQERVGQVLLRRTIEIEHGVLKSVSCPQGTFEKKAGEWIVRQAGTRTTRAGAASTLTDVLPLVSAEQFRMITEEADTAILIQGVAGSGKTTVALHRLAWLMEARKGDLTAEDVLILLFSKPLQKYIESLLPALELEQIKVKGFTEWTASIFRRLYPEFVSDEELATIHRPSTHIPARIQRLKTSMALLDAIENRVAAERAQIFEKIDSLIAGSSLPSGINKSLQELKAYTLPIFASLNRLLDTTSRAATSFGPSHAHYAGLQTLVQQLSSIEKATPTAVEFYLSVFRYPEEIISHDETKLIDRTLINDALTRTDENIRSHALDGADESLLLRIHQVRTGALPSLATQQPALLKHVIADEVQDYTPAELAVIVNLVENPGQLTLVGDVSQAIDESRGFPGWEKLRQRWRLKESIARSISLTVSYRSTLPIMRLADRIHHRTIVTAGRDGRAPIWFQAKKEHRGIEAALKWLEKAIELYPLEMSAVLCTDRQEARHIFSLLKPRFGNVIRLGDDSNFSFEEGLVVSTVTQVKGLEFANVLLWNPSREHYPNNEQGRNLLYVAVTRAIENLCVVSWSRSTDLLPGAQGGLMRLVDLTEEEEEAEEQDPEASRYVD